ncbi:MAG: hypothetical protein GY799_19655 [Desulfobulbaceae bacterium]|nr:hypothetical protein [Desulfobulbaceae bacterium]
MALTDLVADNSSQPSVHKPGVEISFAASSGGGLAPDLSALNGGSSDPWQRSLVFINFTSSLAPFVDTTKLMIANDEHSPAVAIDDEGTIALGYADSSIDVVMTGRIDQLQYDTQNLTYITAVNGGASLSQMRINQSYEQQAAGNLVSDLCSQAEVDTDVVESGIDLPFYVIDDRYNAYEHIHRLAIKSKYIAHFTIEGKLYFGPEQTGQAVQTFSYANDILEVQVQQNNTSATAATVIGEGAAGTEGQEAWSWLIKDPGAVTAEAGNGKVRLIQDATLRSSDACQAAADGVAGRTASQTLTGQILTPGAPAVVVGSTIEITDTPTEEMNGNFFVSRVSHCYSKQHGFTSLIHFKQAGGSGRALGGLL